MNDMNNALAITNDEAELAAIAATKNDLSKLTEAQRAQLYGAVCRSIGLNPLTSPFEYLNLQGRLTLYAKKGATDQIRDLRGISITSIEKEELDGVLMVTATATDRNGRSDSDVGAVVISNLKGDALANAYMKAITKAKRRVTLSMAGLGFLDESEVETIPESRVEYVSVDHQTGEIQQPARKPRSKPTATVEPMSPHDKAKLDLWNLANKTYGWNKEQLEAVGLKLTGAALAEADEERLVFIHDELLKLDDAGLQDLLESATSDKAA